MILPVYGQFLPNNADFNFDKNFDNLHKIKSKPMDCVPVFSISKKALAFSVKNQQAEKRKFMLKCMVFNQWFVDRVNSSVCVQTIENGSVILEGLP